MLVAMTASAPLPVAAAVAVVVADTLRRPRRSGWPSAGRGFREVRDAPFQLLSVASRSVDLRRLASRSVVDASSSSSSTCAGGRRWRGSWRWDCHFRAASLS